MFLIDFYDEQEPLERNRVKRTDQLEFIQSDNRRRVLF